MDESNLTLGDYYAAIKAEHEANNAWSAEQAQKAMDYQTQMSNSAHQREVADLKAAGLNPVLSAGGAGATTGTGVAAQRSDENVQALYGLVKEAFKANMAQANAMQNTAKYISGASYGNLPHTDAEKRVNDVLEEYKDSSGSKSGSKSSNSSSSDNGILKLTDSDKKALAYGVIGASGLGIPNAGALVGELIVLGKVLAKRSDPEIKANVAKNAGRSQYGMVAIEPGIDKADKLANNLSKYGAKSPTAKQVISNFKNTVTSTVKASKRNKNQNK